PAAIRRIYNFGGPRTAAELAWLAVEGRIDTLVYAGDPGWLPVLAKEIIPDVRVMIGESPDGSPAR
ncbi:hypothetical protein, partial [Actinocorallia lasiicapitis]